MDRNVADRAAEDSRRAGGGKDQTEEQLLRGGLAGPVRSQQAEDLPFPNLKVQAVQGAETVPPPKTRFIVLRKTGYLNYSHAGRPCLLSRKFHLINKKEGLFWQEKNNIVESKQRQRRFGFPGSSRGEKR